MAETDKIQLIKAHFLSHKENEIKKTFKVKKDINFIHLLIFLFSYYFCCCLAQTGKTMLFLLPAKTSSTPYHALQERTDKNADHLKGSLSAIVGILVHRDLKQSVSKLSSTIT